MIPYLLILTMLLAVPTGATALAETGLPIKPVDPLAYRIQVGDGLTISLWGSYNMHYQRRVSLDGAISVPVIGQFDVAGLTLQQARDLVQKRSKIFYNKSVQRGVMLTPADGPANCEPAADAIEEIVQKAFRGYEKRQEQKSRMRQP